MSFARILRRVLPMVLLAATALAPQVVLAEVGDKEYAVAAELYNLKSYDLAIDAWSSFLKTAPNHPRAAHGQHYLGISYMNTGQFEQAEAAFQKLIQTHPKFDLLDQSWLFLGMSQFSHARKSADQKAYERAAASFASQTEKFPQGKFRPQSLYYRAECLYALGKKEQAAPLYEQVVADKNSGALKADALYALGVAQEELAQPEAAGNAYQQFLNEFPQHKFAEEVGFRLGESLLARNQFAEAEKRFAVAAESKTFRAADLAMLRHAECLAARKKYPEAAQRFQQLARDFAQSEFRNQALMEAGKCAYLAGDHRAAIASLQPLTSLNDEVGAEAAHWTAQSMIRAGQPAEALKVAEAALKNAGASTFAPQLQLDQADALYELPERRKEAAAAYASLADKHPQDAVAPQARYMAGFAALNAGDYQQALAQAASFLKSYPQSELAADVNYVAAESQLQLKAYDQAASSYQTLLKSHPRHADAEAWKVRLGLALHLQGNAKDTVTALEPVIAEIQTPARKAEALFLLGVSQNQLEQSEAAAKSLLASLAADEKWRQADETYLALAHAQQRLGQLEAARKSVQTAIEKFPNSEALDRAHFLLAEYAFESGDLKTAGTEYQRIIADFAGSPLQTRARYGLGWTHYSRGENPQAVEALTEMLSALPKDAAATDELARRAHYVRGLAQYGASQTASGESKSNRLKEAVADLSLFLKHAPEAAEAADARYMLGLCQAGIGQSQAAVATFQGLLKDFPQYAGADKVRYELAWSLRDLNQDDEATKFFAELADKNSSSPLAAEGRFNVGEAEYANRDFKAAAKSYYQAERQAQQLAKDKVISAEQAQELGEKASHKLGWSYFRQDDFANAEKTFEYQLRVYPQGSLSGDAAFMRGESLFKQKKYREALAALKEVKDVTQPEFLALAVLHSAQAANLSLQFDTALALLENYRERFPDAKTHLEAIYEEGWALQNTGKLDDALIRYEKITAEDKDNLEVAAKARFMIGEIYFEKKDHPKAIIQFFLVAKGYGYPQWQANAYYEAARCFEVLQKPEQALQSYREVLKYADSDKRPLAEQRIKALGGG
jgi:cellulose synthase operon protein C